MADWTQIRDDYISGCESYPALARRYGVSQHGLARRGREEGWPRLRQEKLLEQFPADREARARRLLDISDALAGKLAQAVAELEPKALGSQGGRCLSADIKEQKHIQMNRTPADWAEQEARLRKLSRELEPEEKTITVTIAGGEETWST